LGSTTSKEALAYWNGHKHGAFNNCKCIIVRTYNLLCKVFKSMVVVAHRCSHEEMSCYQIIIIYAEDVSTTCEV
jgi:hypothetical protein